MEKVSRQKVEAAWPLAVSTDTCCRLLKLALGDNWRNLESDPAGAPGTEEPQQEGDAAEEAVGQQEAETAEQEASGSAGGV